MIPKELFTKIMCLRDSKKYKTVDIINQLNTIYGKETIKDFFPNIENQIPDIFQKEKYYSILYDRCVKDGIGIISYIDREYPSKLKDIKYPPLILFYKGNINLLERPLIAIVGSREASVETLEWTMKISLELATRGYVIVSGGAKGIDHSAHSSALKYGINKTICVLGCGLNKIYPKENINLIENIKQKGLVITEHHPDENVFQSNLAYRNRITSGISDGVLIVASKEKGGSKVQADYAISQNKVVICPNPEIGLKPQNGIVQLLNRKEAYLINNVEDILDRLNNYPPLSKNETLVNYKNPQSNLDFFC